jgi:anti-anti-sigma factor
MSTEVPEGFSISAHRHADIATVVVSGELDLHSAKLLDEWLAKVADAPVVEIDAAALTFVDSAGLRSLVVARQTTEARGAVLRFVAASEQLARLVEIAGLTDFLPGVARPGTAGEPGDAGA